MAQLIDFTVVNPQVSFVYGVPFGEPPRCLSCGQPVRPSVGYYALWAGSRDRPSLLGVAHAFLWEGPGEDDLAPWCETALRDRWEQLVKVSGAGVLSVDDTGRTGFLLNGAPLAAGTAIEVLTADGDWLAGWFEPAKSPESAPSLRCPLGGWDNPHAVVTLHLDMLARRTQRSD